MKYLITLGVLVIVGCGLFNPNKYNPNPTPVSIEEPVDSVRVDTIRLTNGTDNIIILDTVKVK